MDETELAGAILQRNRIIIDANIEHITRVLSQTADNNPNMRLLLACLGGAHEQRFDLLGEPHDIDKAIECANIRLTLAPDDDLGLPSLLNDIGAYHGKRFQRVGEMDDINRAIEYLSLALASTPKGDSSLPTRLGNLGLCHSDRFEHLGEISDLEKAIEYKFQALALTPDGDPELPDRLDSLGVSLKNRFKHLGEIGDLEKGIECESRALAMTPDGHPDLPRLLANLAISLSERFERLGDIKDLQKVIEYEFRALALTPDGHPRLADRLANLGMSFKSQFKHMGNPEDLDKAIKYESRALALTPDDHPHSSALLANIGASYTYRFQRLGELEDLEKAIEYQSRILVLTPGGHPDLANRLANLGVSLSNRFERLGELGDLEKSIECESRALALTPAGHPSLLTRFINLGAYHIQRFRGRGELGDLETSIEYQFRALSLTPDDHPQLSSLLSNLGLSLSNRFERLGDVGDLEKAIEYESIALTLTPDSHPSFPDIHFSLAKSRLLLYQHTSNSSYLQESLYSFRMATQSLAGSPRHKFKFAIGWAGCASVNSSLNCIEAYQTAIDLLPQFIWLGATTIQRYGDLISAGSLAVDAAVAAIRISEYGLALEWLEHARCVVWNQSLMLRSPLDALHSHNPALATRIQTVAAQLHHAGSQSRESHSLAPGSVSREEIAQQHRRLALEYTHLISQVRALPEFEDFLRPVKAHDLVRAARSGPVTVISCHETRCDALVVMPGRDQIDHIPLPNFSQQKARTTRLQMEKSVRSNVPRERGVDRRPVLEQELEFENVLASLWYDVVKPILDRLGYTNQVSGGNLPHITWCPTGALSFLPLHAAGDYSQPQSKIYDYVISSYTPTLTALLSSTPSSLSPSSRVLAIGQPNTPGHNSLPGTTKELAYVKTHTLGRAGYLQLTDDRATVSAVLDAMEQHDWVHLACHAHQDVSDPTKSGFFLHNDTLDLESINRRSFKSKGLAYLSACQTATGDERLPDEAIHLVSGMLMSGYSSVVATMWSVMDEDAPLVADKVYGQLMKDGSVGTGEAGKALHYAVAELRQKVGETEFVRWVPYVHIGS